MGVHDGSNGAGNGSDALGLGHDNRAGNDGLSGEGGCLDLGAGGLGDGGGDNLARWAGGGGVVGNLLGGGLGHNRDAREWDEGGRGLDDGWGAVAGGDWVASGAGGGVGGGLDCRSRGSRVRAVGDSRRARVDGARDGVGNGADDWGAVAGGDLLASRASSGVRGLVGSGVRRNALALGLAGLDGAAAALDLGGAGVDGGRGGLGLRGALNLGRGAGVDRGRRVRGSGAFNLGGRVDRGRSVGGGAALNLGGGRGDRGRHVRGGGRLRLAGGRSRLVAVLRCGDVAGNGQDKCGGSHLDGEK